MKLLPIKGPDSYWALQAYIKLLLGLKMLPLYAGKTYEEFFSWIEQMAPDDRKKIVHQAVLFVTLDADEVNALIRFAADKNGVPFTRENTKSLPPGEFISIIQAVAKELAAMNPDFLSPSEKKN